MAAQYHKPWKPLAGRKIKKSAPTQTTGISVSAIAKRRYGVYVRPCGFRTDRRALYGDIDDGVKITKEAGQ